jgi:hypothetical protein
METAVKNRIRQLDAKSANGIGKAARIDYSAPLAFEKGRTLDEVMEKAYDKLSAHYGVDIRAI